MLQLSVIDWGQRSWKTAIPYCLSVGRSCDHCGRYGSRTPTFSLCVHVQCSHKTAHTAAGSRKPPAKVQKIILDPSSPPPPKKKFIVNSANYYIFMNVLSSVDDWQVLPYSPRDWQSADTGGRSQCQSLSAGRGCHWYWQQESEGVLYTSKWATSDYTIVHCKNVRPSCYGQLIINVTVLCYFHNELIISFSQLHSHVAKITICRIYIQFRCKNFLKLQNEKGYIITLTHWVCGKYFVIERYTSHTFITIQYQKWFKDWRKNIVFCHW